MCADMIGNVLDERRPEIAACPLDRPVGHCVDGEVMVAVYPEGRSAETKSTGRPIRVC